MNEPIGWVWKRLDELEAEVSQLRAKRDAARAEAADYWAAQWAKVLDLIDRAKDLREEWRHGDVLASDDSAIWGFLAAVDALQPTEGAQP